MSETRQEQEGAFATHDGVRLFYRRWPATEPRRGAVAMLHRGHEHSGRMAHLAEELDLANFDFFAWDARGHGRSPGQRGDAPGLAALVRDVQCFVDHLREAYGIPCEDVAVLAQSVGAVLAAAWAHDYAPKIRCLVLAAPAFRVKLYVPFALPGLRLLRAVRGNFFVASYVKAALLTHDRQRQASFDADPLVARAISVNVLLGLDETAERVVADAQAIAIPVQVLISGSDWVVGRDPQEEFFRRLASPVKERHVLDGFYHDTLGEAGRRQALDRVRDFILRRFAEAPQRPDLGRADRQGASFEEAAALAAPLPAWSPRGLYWLATRLGLRIGGSLSDGLRLGRETGFDSGSMLDYVYRNNPSGRGPLGRAIDRRYLESVGWRGIRQRKRHIEELLRQAMGLLAAAGRPLRLLDIAAGYGRYVLEALATGGAARPESVLLRDYSDLNVREGRALIRAMGLQDVARFERGDAFDRTSLAAVAPRPTLGIVSGLYELIPDSEPVRNSLAGMASAVEPGGFLLYTGQPWHPQLELIARALTSHRGGRAWVMRRRSQAELDTGQVRPPAGYPTFRLGLPGPRTRRAIARHDTGDRSPGQPGRARRVGQPCRQGHGPADGRRLPDRPAELCPRLPARRGHRGVRVALAARHP